MNRIIDFTDTARERVHIIDIIDVREKENKVYVKAIAKTITQNKEEEFTLIYNKYTGGTIVENTYIENERNLKGEKYINCLFYNEFSSILTKANNFSYSNFMGNEFNFNGVESDFSYTNFLSKKNTFSNGSGNFFKSHLSGSFSFMDFSLSMEKSDVVKSNLKVSTKENNISILFNGTNFFNSQLDFKNISIVADRTNEDGINFYGCTFNRCKYKVNDCYFENMHHPILTIERSFFEKTTFDISHNKFINCRMHFRYITFLNCTNEMANLDCKHTSIEYSHCVYRDTDVTFIDITDFGVFVLNKINFIGGNFTMTLVESVECNVVFQRSEYNCGFIINRCNFFANFKSCDFNKSMAITDNFMKYMHFEKCKFFSIVNIDNEDTKNLFLDDCIINNVFNIKQIKSKEKAEYMEYENLSFHKTICLGRIELDYKKNNVYKAMVSNFNALTSMAESKNHELSYDLVEQLRMLKENFNNVGRYDDEDRAFLDFRKHSIENLKKETDYKDPKYRFNRDINMNIFQKLLELFLVPLSYLYTLGGILIKNKNNKDNLRKSLNLFSLTFLMDIGSFATDPFKIAKTIISTQVFFIVSYGLLFGAYRIGYEAVDLLDVLRIPLKATYFSLITFFTVGFGDISQSLFNESVPIKYFVAFLSSIEAFFGVFLMGYFSVSIVRKTLR
ncbi:MAG: potassium channel family protein [Lachnospirales bacterium]